MGVSPTLLVAPEDKAVAVVGFIRDKIALPPSRRMRWGGCGVSACATAVPALPSSQIWPSLARGACTSGATHGWGGMLGMVLFVVISSISAMVVRVIWRVARRISCRVYVKYGTECVEIKVVELWTNDLTKTKLLN